MEKSSDVSTLPQRRPAALLNGRAHKAWLFARNFVKHPRMLGSIIPSSPFLVRRLLNQIDWENARVVVEYGPGIGNITAEVLKRLRPDGVLIAIDTNGEFVSYIRDSIQDRRLHVFHGSAADVAKFLRQINAPHADYVISGIPFSTIPTDIRETILRETQSALRPEGALLVYQFSRAVFPYLKRVFGTVTNEFEPLNVLPAQLFYCRR
jgi:phospholipid N-methyltransferase